MFQFSLWIIYFHTDIKNCYNLKSLLIITIFFVWLFELKMFQYSQIKISLRVQNVSIPSNYILLWRTAEYCDIASYFKFLIPYKNINSLVFGIFFPLLCFCSLFFMFQYVGVQTPNHSNRISICFPCLF